LKPGSRFLRFSRLRDEESRTDEEQQGKCHLRYYQRLSESDGRGAGDGGDFRLLNVGARSGRVASKRGIRPKMMSGRERDCDGEA